MRKSGFVFLLWSFFVIVAASTSHASLITSVAGGGTISPAIGLPAINIDTALSRGKIDQDGYLYIASYNSWYYGQSWSALRVNPWGIIDRVYIDQQLLNYGVSFDDLCVDGEGNLYLPTYTLGIVYKITPAGVVSIYAGGGTGGDGGPATEAQLDRAESVAMDLNGNLYIAEYDHPIIRKVDRNGIISTFFDATPLGVRYIDTLHADVMGNVYFFDDNSWRVYKIDPQGVASAVAGNGTEGNSGEGVPATQAQLKYVYGITSDDWGNIFLTNTSNGSGVIRKVDAFGIITTVASFPSSNLNRLSVDRDGMIFVTDYGFSSVVKKLAFSPELSGVTPSMAAVGERIKLTGRYFTSQGTAGTVTFNGIPATILSWSNETIVCIVPPGATTGNVMVTAPDGQQSAGINFKVR